MLFGERLIAPSSDCVKTRTLASTPIGKVSSGEHVAALAEI